MPITISQNPKWHIWVQISPNPNDIQFDTTEQKKTIHIWEIGSTHFWLKRLKQLTDYENCLILIFCRLTNL